MAGPSVNPLTECPRAAWHAAIALREAVQERPSAAPIGHGEGAARSAISTD